MSPNCPAIRRSINDNKAAIRGLQTALGVCLALFAISAGLIFTQSAGLSVNGQTVLYGISAITGGGAVLSGIFLAQARRQLDASQRTAKRNKCS